MHVDYLGKECKRRRMRPKRSMQGEVVEVDGGRIIRALARKDRHSKVCTAKGPKDRRVRLSADTAIRFYDVQDRLGYDKPSLAIDWLINEAKSAIDALPPIKSSPPSTMGVSECFHQENEGYYNVQNQEQNVSEFQTSSLNSFFNNYPESFNLKSTSLFSIDSTHLDFEGDREMAQFQRMVTWDLNPGSSNEKEFDIDSSFPWHLGDFADKNNYDLFTQREPLQSSYLPSTQAFIPTQDTPFGIEFATDGFLGLTFPTCTQGQEEDRENLVPKELSAASSVLHYRD